MVEETKLGGPLPPRRRWPYTRRQVIGQIIVATVILGSGIGIGAGGTLLMLKNRMFPPFPPERDADALVDRWRTDFALTDAQARQIKDMFTKRRTAARKRWEEIWKLEQTEREAFAKSMKTVLTPEQYAKWLNQLNELKEREKRFRRWRPGGPRGPGGLGGPDGHRSRGPRGTKGPGPDYPPEFGPGGPPEPGPERHPEFEPQHQPEPNQLEQQP